MIFFGILGYYVPTTVRIGLSVPQVLSVLFALVSVTAIDVLMFRGARTIGETDGYVKILADMQTDRVLGVHIIGAQAGDLIAEAAMAIEFGASSEDIARTSHAHPSLAEVLKEAAFATFDRAISI